MAGLNPDTECTVFVEPEGNSWLPSGRLTFRTLPLPFDNEAPSRPGTPIVTALNGDTVTITWAPATDNISVHRYRIIRILNASAVFLSSANNNTATMSRLDWDADFTVRVFADDVNGNASPASEPVSFRTTPDVGTSCTYRYAQQTVTSGGAAAGTRRGTVWFTNTGHYLDGWTLRVSVVAGLPAPVSGGPIYTIGNDLVVWHFRGGNYAMSVGGTERVQYEFTTVGASTTPPLVALNGHACSLTLP